jgi:hypothetical protein
VAGTNLLPRDASLSCFPTVGPSAFMRAALTTPLARH